MTSTNSTASTVRRLTLLVAIQFATWLLFDYVTQAQVRLIRVAAVSVGFVIIGTLVLAVAAREHLGNKGQSILPSRGGENAVRQLLLLSVFAIAPIMVLFVLVGMPTANLVALGKVLFMSPIILAGCLAGWDYLRGIAKGDDV